MHDINLDDAESVSAVGFNEKISEFLHTIGNWAKFFSILGFIGLGFMIFGSFAFFIMGNLPTGQGVPSMGHLSFMPKIVGFAYLIMVVIYFFPVLYMYNFATKIKAALSSNNQNDYENAFENLKKHFVYVGIITIIIVSIYVFIFLLGIIGLTMR